MLEHVITSKNLRIGTCSWKYDSWKGLVYNPDKKYTPHDYLPDYAKHFNTVEIDQWFWSLFPGAIRLPKPKDVQQYAESVPKEFRFSLKAPNAITLTHYYGKQSKGSERFANQPNPHFLDHSVLEQFLDLLEPMKGKLGPIMFQFEYLNKTKMPSLRVFLDQLAVFFEKAPSGYQYGIEIRNPNYLKTEFFAFLKEHRIGTVLMDGYYMPPVGEVVADHNVYTSDFLVLRLHGPGRQDIEKKTKGLWNQIIEPRDQGLRYAANLITDCQSRSIETYVNVNNHYEGSAPLSIQRLEKLL